MSPAAALLQKYGMQGPRYTSYPTAPCFRPEEDRAALRNAWRAASADLSVYLHVPFCQVRCTFCGCHVEIKGRRETATPYVDLLLRELDLCGGLVDLSRPLRQLHLGGGTPNYLLPEDMRRLLLALRARLDVQPDAELAIECDPRRLDRDYVDMLLDCGMNRFSFGVQDLDPDVMKAVNRPQELFVLETVIGFLRARGPVSLNLDLIYGLPRQTIDSWDRTLRDVARLRPSRLAVYGYAHVPWLKKQQRALERHGLPSPDLRADLATHARELLVAAGYDQIGMDHYALPDDELARARRDGTLHRNFMGYTTRRGLDQVAVGVSAISKVGRSYTQDHKDRQPWAESLECAEMPWERGLVLTDDDVLRGDVITELSCNGRLDFGEIERRHGIRFAEAFARELEALREMERDGLLELRDDGLRLTDTGFYLVRNACMVFDAWLPRDGANTPRFSSTT
jgi:oxygen-independent coproporphyrinogen-3 oxidase